MAKEVLRNVSMFYGPLALASQTNQLDTGVQAAEVDVTNFGSAGWNEAIAGLASAAWKFDGFWDADAVNSEPDETTFESVGVAGVAASAVKANPPVDGDIAYFLNVLSTHYQYLGQMGEAAKMSLAMKGTAPMVRGRVLEYVVDSAATHNGASLQLGAVGATQRLYLAIHVFGVSGTTQTLDVVIQSDDATGFPSATTRITVPQFTGLGTYYTSIAGPITDDWFRTSVTIGGTGTPKLSYLAVLGKR